MSGASPMSERTRSVADMTRRRRSSRRPCCASSANARPRSASSERSWNSSNMTAATPSSEGSSRICRVNTPSVTTSTRVRFETRLCRRTRKPIVSPTFSPNVAAMWEEAARAARRRGSSSKRRLPLAQGSSSSASGARVVLPAPGGATRTAFVRAASAARSAGSASSIGRGAYGSDFIARIEDRGSTRNAFACRIDDLVAPRQEAAAAGARRTLMDQRLTAILPCNDLDAAQAFFERLGFALDPGSSDDYRMLSDGLGAHIHLNPAVAGWLQSGRNPFGLYLYREDVDGAAAAFAGEV